MMLDLPGGGWLAWDYTGRIAAQFPPSPPGERLTFHLALCDAFEVPAALIIGERELLDLIAAADAEWLRTLA